jgi:hypothetical protein
MVVVSKEGKNSSACDACCLWKSTATTITSNSNVFQNEFEKALRVESLMTYVILEIQKNASFFWTAIFFFVKTTTKIIRVNTVQ